MTTATPRPTAPPTVAPLTSPPTRPATASPTELPRGVVHLQRADGSRLDVRVEIAANQAARARGLMFRTALPEDAGMLFVFPDDTDGPFWMMDTFIPLSIAFIGADGRIVSIKDMRPRSTQLTHPDARYRYALEVNQGFFDRTSIRVGDRAELPG
jgi:hypothetical protein